MGLGGYLGHEWFMERKQKEQRPGCGASLLGFRDSKMTSVTDTGECEGENGR